MNEQAGMREHGYIGRTCLRPGRVGAALRALQHEAEPREHAHEPPILRALPHLRHSASAP